MFLYIHHVGATMETVAHEGHTVTSPRGRIAAETCVSARCHYESRWPRFFLTSTKHEFSPLPLDCTFQFLTIPVDYCSCDSPQVPEPSSHILGAVFAPASCDLCLRLESEQADSPARGRETETETTQTSCTNMNAEVFQMFFFYLINLVTTFKWSKTHIAL